MTVIEGRESLAVVNGFANNKHRCQGEVVLMYNTGKILELAAVDTLVGPCEVVAGCNGCVLRIFHQEFALDFIHNSGTEEDAHG